MEGDLVKLDLDIEGLVATGRRELALSFEVVRPIRPSDLALLATARPSSVVPELKKVTERHHTLARALASGAKPGEAAVALGWTAARVSVLKNSPAFIELLEFYRNAIDKEFAEFGGRLAGLGKDAILALQERLEEDPDSIETKDLLKIATALADRTGFGPTKTVEQNVNVSLTERLKQSRLRAKQAMQGDVIEAEVIESSDRA